MARHIMEEYRVKQVKRDGKMYRFSVMHEPEYAPVSGAYFEARTEVHASVWTGYDWRTLHRYYL